MCKHRDMFLKSIAKETDEIVLTNLRSEYKNLELKLRLISEKAKKNILTAILRKTSKSLLKFGKV